MKKNPPNRHSSDKPKIVPAAVSPAPAESSKDSNIDTRLAIPLDKEGKVLVANMRETSREKLKDLMQNATLAKELGISADASPVAAGMALPAELMYPLISGLSILDTLIIARATKAPRELVERIVPYSREETQLLAPAFARVLEKYSGSFLSKYGDEAALLALVVSMSIHKLSLVREEMEKLPRPRGVVVPIVPQDNHAGPASEEPQA